MKSQTEVAESETGIATLSAAGVGRGLFQSRLRYAPQAGAQESGEYTAVTRGRAFSRRVGARYSLQVILNSLPLLATDILVIMVTIAACRLAFFQLGVVGGMDVLDCLLPITVGFVLLNFELGLYPGAKLSPVEELRRLFVSVTLISIVWAIGVVVLKETLGVHAWFLLAVYFTSLFTLPICRSWMRHLLGRYTKWGIPAIVCGDDIAAVRVYHWLAENHHLGLRPVGLIGDRTTLDVGPDDTWYAGSWTETQEIAEKRNVFWAIVVPSEDKPTFLPSHIADYLYTIPQVHVLSELTGLPDHWNPERLDGLAGIHLQQNLMLPLPRLTKRVMDLVVATLGCIVLLPLLFYIAVAVKLSSRGPVFYANERIGRGGKRFRMWKFRSMFTDGDAVLEDYLERHPECREEWESTQKLKLDPRITRIGRFIRKTSLDELPQLWNVLRGDMSLVGPRPILLNEEAKYGEYYGLYTMVSPGITGMWQVCGRNNTTYQERLMLVAYYVRNWSPWIDVVLLLKTIRIVLFTRGAY